MSPEEFFTKVQHLAVELLTFIIEQEPVLFKLPEELVQDVIAFIRTEENDDEDEQAVSTTLFIAAHASFFTRTVTVIRVCVCETFSQLIALVDAAQRKSNNDRNATTMNHELVLVLVLAVEVVVPSTTCVFS